MASGFIKSYRSGDPIDYIRQGQTLPKKFRVLEPHRKKIMAILHHLNRNADLAELRKLIPGSNPHPVKNESSHSDYWSIYVGKTTGIRVCLRRGSDIGMPPGHYDLEVNDHYKRF